MSENADHSTEEPAEGGQEADGGEMTDGVEEDFDEDGGHELVGMQCLVSTSVGWQQQNLTRESMLKQGVNHLGLLYLLGIYSKEPQHGALHIASAQYIFY